MIEEYTLLVAMKDELSNKGQIEEIVVADYNNLVEGIEKKTGMNLSGYKIPRERLEPKLLSFNYMTGDKEFSNEIYCNKFEFGRRINALLLRFEIGEDKPIGFTI